jgi:hypothetical protein
VRAEVRRIAELGFLRSLPGGSCGTMGAVHEPTLLVQLYFERMSITEVWPLCQDVVLCRLLTLSVRKMTSTLYFDNLITHE